MYFYGSLLGMFASYGILLFLYFKSRTDENKIFFQSGVVTVYYLLSVVTSQVGLILYSDAERAAVAGVGTALIVFGGLGALAVTFVMGIAGAVSSYREKRTPLMVVSILAMLVFPFALPLFLFPPLFLYLAVKKGWRWGKGTEHRNKMKKMKGRMAELKGRSQSKTKRKR